jgi:hypothetical protein
MSRHQRIITHVEKFPLPDRQGERQSNTRKRYVFLAWKRVATFGTFGPTCSRHSVSVRRIVRHIRAVLSNFDELLVRRTMQSVQSSVFVHLHHTAAVVLHLHTTATGSRSGRWCADCYNWIVHINRSRLVEFQRGFDCLARL